MTETEHTFGTLGDRFGDLGPALEAKREPIARFDPPSDRRVVAPFEIARALWKRRRPSHIGGAYGSATALVARSLVALGVRPIIVVEDLASAEEAARDATFFLGPSAPPVLTASLGRGHAVRGSEPRSARGAQEPLSAVLSHLHRDLAWSALVVPVTALARKVVPRSALDAAAMTIREGDEIDREDLARRLVEAGYARSPVVEDP